MKKAILYIDSMQRGGAQRVMSVLSKFLSDRGIYTVLVNDIIPEEGKAEYSVDSRGHRVFLDKNLSLIHIQMCIRDRYTIVGGVPAKFIKMQLTDDERFAFEQLK